MSKDRNAIHDTSSPTEQVNSKNTLDFDNDAPESFSYYMLGERPVRVTVWNGAPTQTETINLNTKTLEIDNNYIMEVCEASDSIKVTEKVFIDQCLRLGVNLKS